MRQLHSSSAFLLLTMAVVAFGCAGPSAEKEAPGTAAPEEGAAAHDPAGAVAGLTGEGLTLTPMPGSPKFPDATLVLEEAGARQAGANTFEFAVTGYDLGAQTADAGENGLANSGKGQHVHFIVDNGPYSAHYEPTAEVELAAGHHVVLAFLSRSYHESLKGTSAYVLQQFDVGDGEEEGIDLSSEHMFYSRPKGTYSGADTEQLMLDFYLVNTMISPTGNRVLATINGAEFEITEWVPHVIEGLPLGEVEISLELVDADGNRVPGPFNQVTRTVTLAAAD